MPSPLIDDPYTTLRSSRRRHSGVACLSGVFVVLGWFLVSSGHPVAGWLNIGLFGLCLAVALVMVAAPGSLSVTPRGMLVRHLGRDWPLLAWEHCSDFAVWEAGRGTSLVVFTYRGPRMRWRPGMSVRGSGALTGRNAGLPDTYGLSAEELATLLESARTTSLRA